MALRNIFEEPLFINIKEQFTPKPEFLQRTTPSVEPTGLRQFAETLPSALGTLGRTLAEAPGRPVEEALTARGVAPGLALGAGFAADIATPLPGGEFKKAPRVFKGFKDLTTKILERLKGKAVTSNSHRRYGFKLYARKR